MNLTQFAAAIGGVTGADVQAGLRSAPVRSARSYARQLASLQDARDATAAAYREDNPKPTETRLERLQRAIRTKPRHASRSAVTRTRDP